MRYTWKKPLVLIFVLSLVFLSTSTLRAACSTENLLFSDNFESTSIGSFPSAWTLVFNGMGNQFQHVIYDPLNSTNKCFQLQGERNWAADAVRYFSSNSDTIGFEVSVLVTANTGTPADDVKVGLWKQVNWGQAKWTDGVVFTDNGTIVARDFVDAEGTGTVLQTYVPGQWYHIRFVLDRPNQLISVYVDGALKGELIKGSNLPYVFDGLALSGRYTEILVDYDNVKIFEGAPIDTRQKPVLSVLATSSTSMSDFKVRIAGNLTCDGAAISRSPILLSYSVNGGKSWVDLSLVQTDLAGNYYAQWQPSVTGYYSLKAVYEGNDDYSDATDIVNFALEPYKEQNVFFVNSNSTLSEFAFNSTSRKLSFGLYGDSGTTGYVYVSIPKSLIHDISKLAVYLDGNLTEYSYQTQEDGWLLYFTYHHSYHTVDVVMKSSPLLALHIFELGVVEIAILVLMITFLVVSILVLAIVLRKWKVT